MFQDATGATACKTCPGGWVRPAGDGTPASCRACTAGRFRAEAGKQGCAECAPGFFQATLAATTCDACAAGTYRANSAVAATTCFKCAPGKIPNADKSGCVTCAAGRIAAPGDAVCRECLEGKYASADHAQCVALEEAGATAAADRHALEERLGAAAKAMEKLHQQEVGAGAFFRFLIMLYKI